MKLQTQTSKFNSGEKAGDTSEPVTKVANRSKAKKGYDLTDKLMVSLGPKSQVLPRDQMKWTHSKRVQATGAHYSPGGAFGRMKRAGAGRGVYSYGGNVQSAAPGNAVGSPPNRIGGDALAAAFRPQGIFRGNP